MIFFDALADLDRVIARGGLRRQDQVFVPHALRDGAGEDAWSAFCGRLDRVGARVHVAENLARVCVVTLDELNSGMGPPTR